MSKFFKLGVEAPTAGTIKLMSPMCSVIRATSVPLHKPQGDISPVGKLCLHLKESSNNENHFCKQFYNGNRKLNENLYYLCEKYSRGILKISSKVNIQSNQVINIPTFLGQGQPVVSPPDGLSPLGPVAPSNLLL